MPGRPEPNEAGPPLPEPPARSLPCNFPVWFRAAACPESCSGSRAGLNQRTRLAGEHSATQAPGAQESQPPGVSARESRELVFFNIWLKQSA